MIDFTLASRAQRLTLIQKRFNVDKLTPSDQVNYTDWVGVELPEQI